MDATTEVLLFAAARSQHVAELIRPFLASGGVVVCDRFADSTYAYQGYGLGRDLQELQAITRFATGGLQPDLTIYLDLPVAEGLARKRLADQRAETLSEQTTSLVPPPEVEWNRLDAREIAFHERVRHGYLALMAGEPRRWLAYDGRQDRDTLTTRIWETIEPQLMRHAPLQGVRS